MRQLILLYWGCVFLMYLSQVYYPTSAQLEGPQTGRRHFMLRKADIFMIIVIAWLTCFSFLRTSYNDTGTYITHFMQSETAADFLREMVYWIGRPIHSPNYIVMLCAMLLPTIISISSFRHFLVALQL